MKTYKIKLVVESYIDFNIDEWIQQMKQALPDGILLVKSSATEIEC